MIFVKLLKLVIDKIFCFYYDFITSICENQKGVPLHKLNLREGVIAYLKSGDLNDDQIQQLIEFVTEGYKAHS